MANSRLTNSDGPARLYRPVGSRPFALIIALVGLALLCLNGPLSFPPAFCSPRPGFLLHDLTVALPYQSSLATLIYLGSCLMLVWLVRRHNLHHSLSDTYAAMMLLMGAALPAACGALQPGLLLLPVMLLCVALMFGMYQSPDRTRRCMVVFLCLGAGAMVNVGFVLFVPVMFIGLAQMRVFTPRMVAAALIGLLVPYWLAWAFGCITISDFIIPLGYTVPAGDQLLQSLPQVCAVAVTMLAGLITASVNMLVIYTRNARTRALNGLLLILGTVSGIACVADWPNMLFYVPLLCGCTAYQIGLFYSLYAKQRPYMFVLTLMSIYFVLSVWILLNSLL